MSELWKVSLTKPTRQDLPNLRLPHGFRLIRGVLPSNGEGKPKFLANQNYEPIQLDLHQDLGHDPTLLYLFQQVAGFGLKLTLSFPVQSGASVKYQDALDINIDDLVPTNFQIGDFVSLSAVTLTPAKYKWIQQPPKWIKQIWPEIEEGR